VALARVDEETDEDQDVLVWDDELGWLVDVHFVGGPLDGDGPVNCRIASSAQGSGVIRAAPPRPNSLVVVLVPNGDANDDAIIIGQLTDEDNAAPTTVNGDTIVERDAADGEVAAIETHITAASGEDKDQEWRDVRVSASGEMQLLAEEMKLGIPEADQPFVRGDDFADAFDSLIDAIGDFAESLATATPAPPNGALTTAVVAAAFIPLQVALEQAKTARQTYLSTRIEGD